MQNGNAVVAQSGGPTAVINNSVCGVVQEWLRSGVPGTIFGALFGIKGIIENNLLNLSLQKGSIIDGLKYTPGAALGSSRYRLRKEEDFLRLLQMFKENNIRYFFYIGGNDSMDTAARVQKLAERERYEMSVIGIPKTIDNDLSFTDHCPGYGSAAKFLAATVMETGLDLKNLVTNNRVVVLETMGRNTGWLAAASALARRREQDPPHLIYFPEVPFKKDNFLADVERVYQNTGYVYIVASEGLVDREGKYIFAGKSTDSFGHVQLGGLADTMRDIIQSELGLKVRANVLGTLQRSAMHYASLTDALEAYMVGRQAVKLALQGRSGVMVTLFREDAEEYRCITGSVALEKVANVERKLPYEWINDAGNDVTDDYIRYARPLITGEVRVPHQGGLPDYVSLEGFDITEERLKSGLIRQGV